MTKEPRRYPKGIVVKSQSDGPSPSDSAPTCNITGHISNFDALTTETVTINLCCNVNVCTNTFTVACHGLSNGDQIKVTTVACCAPTTCPINLLDLNDKAFVIGICGNDFQLSEISGGCAICISATGSGNYVITVIEDQLNVYMDGENQKIVTNKNKTTLENKILCCVTLNGNVSGTAIDTCLCCVSCCHDTLASAKSIKDYIDCQNDIQNLCFTDDCCTACLCVDLNDETLKFAGGSAISTTGACNTITHSVCIACETSKVCPVAADSVLIADSADSCSIKKSTFTQISGAIDHDATTNFVANEHVDHTSVCINAGTGLSGGGDISTSRTLNVCITGECTVACLAPCDEFLIYDVSCCVVRKSTVAGVSGTVNHDCTNGFVANEHIDHSTVNINTGEGLTGGGDITTCRTISVDIPGQCVLNCVGATDEILIYDVSCCTHKRTDVSNLSPVISHDCTTGFVADEHIRHSCVCITAGNGLTGGGDISASRTIDVAGTTNEISVSACAVGIADNPILPGTGAVTVPDGTTCQRPCVPTNGMFRYNTSTSEFEGYQLCTWGAIGGGGSGNLDVFHSEKFASNFSVNASGNNATFGAGCACLDGEYANDCCVPLSGTTSGTYTASCCSDNDWIKLNTICLDLKQRATTIKTRFLADMSCFSSDVRFVIYDETNCVVLTDSLDILCACADRSFYEFATYIPSCVTQISYGFHFVCTTTACDSFSFDDFEFSTNPFFFQDVFESTEWESFTPTGSFTTNTTYTGKQRRVGDTMEVELRVSFSGAPNATTFGLTIPNGYNIDTNKVTDSSTGGTQFGLAEASDSGLAHLGVVKMGASSTEVRVYGDDGTGPWSNTVPFTIGSGDAFYVRFAVPIEGWVNTSENVIVAASKSSEEYEANTASGTRPSTNDYSVTFTNEVKNTLDKFATITNDSTSGIVLTAKQDIEVVAAGNFADNASSQTFGFLLEGDSSVSFLDNTNDDIRKGVATNTAGNPNDTAQASFTMSVGETLKLAGTLNSTIYTGSNNELQFVRFLVKPKTIETQGAIPVQQTAYAKDVKAQNTDGGTFTSGSWQTRDLNTLEGDTGFITLSSNEFTLNRGKYNIAWEAPAIQVDSHKSRLYNVTDASEESVGAVSRSSNSGGTMNTSNGFAQIDLNSSKAFRIEHYAQTTHATTGFGVGSNAGDGSVEVFTQVKITKLK